MPLEAARRAQIVQMTTLYSNTNRLMQLHDDVLALREQVQKGSTSGTALAYSLLKAQLFAGSTELSSRIQVQTTSNDVPTVSDLDTLVATTEAHLKSTQDQITQLASAFRQGTAYSLPPLETLAKTDKAFPDVTSQHQAVNLMSSSITSQTLSLVNDPKMADLEATYQKYVNELDQREQQLYVLTQEQILLKLTIHRFPRVLQSLQLPTLQTTQQWFEW